MSTTSAYSNLGFNYETMGAYDKGAEVMRKVFQMYPDSTVALSNLAGRELALLTFHLEASAGGVCQAGAFLSPERRPFDPRSVIAIPTNICYHDDAVEVVMPEYVIEREIPGAGNLSDAEVQEIARKSVGVLNDMGPKIKWLHSYVTGDKVYCVYFAPDEETIREHGRRGGFPVNRVSAVRRMIDPSTAG